MPGYTKEMVEELNKNLEDLAKGKISPEEAAMWGANPSIIYNNDYKSNVKIV